MCFLYLIIFLLCSHNLWSIAITHCCNTLELKGLWRSSDSVFSLHKRSSRDPERTVIESVLEPVSLGFQSRTNASISSAFFKVSYHDFPKVNNFGYYVFEIQFLYPLVKSSQAPPFWVRCIAVASHSSIIPCNPLYYSHWLTLVLPPVNSKFHKKRTYPISVFPALVCWHSISYFFLHSAFSMWI